MDVREKLVELIGSTEYGNGSLVGKNFQKGFIEKIASNLIANGVTVQEWIPVTERLPEQYHSVIVWTSNKELGEAEHDGKQFRWAYGDECANATHWMPLPQPPKGE